MRHVEFHNKEDLEKIIGLLESDAKILKEKLDQSFESDFLSFCHWSMDDLISTKATLTVLYRVLERANADNSEYQNTFEQFVMWHLSSFDYSRLDKIQGYEANAWKNIYDDIKWIDIK